MSVKILSIGFYSTKSSCNLRGPMALKHWTKWFWWLGELDFMFRFASRTGDSPFYCTILAYYGCCCGKYTSKVALADAKRSIHVYVWSFNVPVLELLKHGVFQPEELPENKYYILGKKALRIFRRFRCAFLGEFLLVQSIRSWRWSSCSRKWPL
jgi:hypothetical protein